MTSRTPDLSQGRTHNHSFVALTPPLPCVDAVAGTGFVHGLAHDQLLLQFTAPERAADTATLTLSLSDQQSFVLPVSLTVDGPQRFVARAQTPEALSRLGDLLNLVRKSQHIAICESLDVEAKDRDTGFGLLNLVPCALPELAWEGLDTSVTFLGRRFGLPLLITGMTGGLARGAEINRRLARAAQTFGIPMGVGSQRLALEHPEHAGIFRIKDETPGVFLIANLGIAQVRGPGSLDRCRQAIEMIEADALAVHVNVLQELIQVEGDRDFRHLLEAVGKVAHQLGVPLMIKEVGGGLDPRTAKRLAELGVTAFDCGGKGGTSWNYIEGLRAQSPVTKAVATTFRDFGIPTAVSVASLREALPKAQLVATGGIRDGLTVAKAIALGADLCGIGLPLLRAALLGDEETEEVLATLVSGLKTAMMATGAATLADLEGRLHCPKDFAALVAKHTAPTGRRCRVGED